MTPPSLFDDPRHRASEELAFRADRAKDRPYTAHALWADAGHAEAEVVLESSHNTDNDRIRGVLAVSAASLLIKGRNFRAAVKFIAEMLLPEEQLHHEAQDRLRQYRAAIEAGTLDPDNF